MWCVWNHSTSPKKLAKPWRKMVKRLRTKYFQVGSAACVSIFARTIKRCTFHSGELPLWLTSFSSYLCGTDEGLIHRCSTIYNEKYLESYRGHTGPVYKVHWSPFVENVFLSASADWTVRIWMIEHEEASMVFSSSTFKAVVDAIWSPKSATMFFCISENTIEIWDLSQST